VNPANDGADTDNDGICNSGDGCPTDPNKTEPGQCGCGFSDVDADGDMVADCIDLCPLDPNKSDPGDCGCGVPDTDNDMDGTSDCIQTDLDFERGNANSDNTVDIGDGIFILQFLFNSGVAPLCLDAADANNDEIIDLSDAIYLVQYIFAGGTEPPAPFPDCGADDVQANPADELLNCVTNTICPGNP